VTIRLDFQPAQLDRLRVETLERWLSENQGSIQNERMTKGDEMKQTSVSISDDHHDESAYSDFLAGLAANFKRVVDGGAKLFSTDAEKLFDVFLSELPEGEIRQHYNCHACRRFVDMFGGIVTIDELGQSTPSMWSGGWASGLYAASVEALRKAVAKAKVTGVFIGPKSPWGLPVTGEWHHMHVVPPAALANPSRKLTPGQLIAEKREEYGMLCRGLADFPKGLSDRAVALLEGDALYRSEKCLGVAKWFSQLHCAIDGEKNRTKRDNLVWRAVADAPVGWCHVRSTMIGTLLEDLATGMDFDTVARRFRDKMHPLQYQRPQAPPTAGNIEAAEKLVEKLGLARSLERRFATLADIKPLWTPPAIVGEEKKSGGVFGHLKEDAKAPDLIVPPKAITWEKFAATVLPTAERIDYLVPFSGPFITLVTSVHADAPPILQWDHEDARNPVSWYVYNGGATAAKYRLTPGQWCEVTAVTLLPPQWRPDRNHANQGKGAVFIIKGAVDADNKCLGLFPEFLKSDLHEIRATIEAFSRRGKLEGAENASACGVDVRAFDQSFRVKQAGSAVAMNYKIDRWD